MITCMVAARNEEDHLKSSVLDIISSAKQTGLEDYEIIIVNDGSTDQTAKIANELKEKHSCIKVIHHKETKGIGFSVREAIDLSTKQKFAFFAGDHNWHPEMAKGLFENCQKAPFVITYFVNTESRKRIRNLLSTIFSTIYITIFDLHVKYINGNAVYDKHLLKNMSLKSTGFSIFAEIHVKLLRTGVLFLEIPTFMSPDTSKSQALRLKTLLNVSFMFLSLVFEIYVTKREQYSKQARRMNIPL